MTRYRDVPEDYVYRLFYPAPVYVLSCALGKDEDALAAVWVTPLSLKPCKVGVVLSPERYSYSLIRRSKRYAINKLAFRYTSQMAFLGDVSKRFQTDKVEASGLHMVVGRNPGVRVIREADAVIECALSSTVEAGDHDILVGDVLAAYATADFDAIWSSEGHSYSSYLGSVGEAETTRRIFVSPEGEVRETRWPRSDAVAKRNRDHRAIEEAGLALKGMELHEAAKSVSSRTGIHYRESLVFLEEMRRQGLVHLGGRLLPSDFE